MMSDIIGWLLVQATTFRKWVLRLDTPHIVTASSFKELLAFIF